MLLVSNCRGFARPVMIETFEPYPCSKYAKAKGHNISRNEQKASVSKSTVNSKLGKFQRETNTNAFLH